MKAEMKEYLMAASTVQLTVLKMKKAHLKAESTVTVLLRAATKAS